MVWRLIIVQGDWGNVFATSSSVNFYGKFIFSSDHFLHLPVPNFVTTTGHNLKISGLSSSSLSVLTLTVVSIYTRLQVYVSAPGGIGIYIHIGIQNDTDYWITYHFFGALLMLPISFF